MSRIVLKTLCPLLLAFLFLPLAAVAQDTGQETAAADHEAMMAAWMKAAATTEKHTKLAEHAGTWKAKVTSWMAPGAEPEVSEGTFRRELMLGGRVLQEHFESTFAGKPFVGFGLTGYDNVTSRWWSTWADNMSTGLIVMWGEWDEDENAVVYHGTSPDPMSGEMVKMKIITRHPEDGKEVVEMYDLRSGEPVKTMEIVSARQ